MLLVLEVGKSVFSENDYKFSSVLLQLVMEFCGAGSVTDLVKGKTFYCRYCKAPKFLDSRKIAVIHLKFKQRGQT